MRPLQSTKTTILSLSHDTLHDMILSYNAQCWENAFATRLASFGSKTTTLNGIVKPIKSTAAAVVALTNYIRELQMHLSVPTDDKCHLKPS